MDMYEGEQLLFGAQNCSHKESGAYTGEVSAAQLASVGVDFVIVGHSERSEHFGETNLMLKEINYNGR
jgi:triosephosphate isomerase